MPADENHDLRKQIGCMNGIIQLFARRHFLAGRNISSHHHKRLLLGAQQQLEPHNARKAVREKDLKAQKTIPRVFSGSSQASNSSSSSSSTLSSLDYNRQISTPKSPSQITAMKKQKHSSTKGQQSPDIRDVVKDSMYREAHCAPIKTSANDKRKLKHADSPRPVQHSKSGKLKASVYEDKTNSKDERLALPRFSYDERESRDAVKTNMKLKECPRFSLDSKTSPIKCSALDSRLNFLSRDENENSLQVPPVNQESGNHSRSNSIVAKLMGLDAFPHSISTDESSTTKSKSSPSPSPRIAFLPELSTAAEGSKQKPDLCPSPVSQNNPASPPPRLQSVNTVRKQATCVRFPIEPTPWEQQDYDQGSLEMATQSVKALTNSPHPSSVYGEIERRITELEFKRSGKDLRALKQILEAMQKTRERLENQKSDAAELKMQEKSSLRKETPNLQKLQTEDPRHKQNSAQKERARCRIPRNNNMQEANQRTLFMEKKITCRNLVVEGISKSPQRIQVENSTTPTRGFGMVSPTVRYIVAKAEKDSDRNRSTSESSIFKRQTSKKVGERCPCNRIHRVESTGLQLNDEQLSNHSREIRYSCYHGDTTSTKSESNNSIASHTDTEVIRFANSISTNPKEQDYITTLKEHMPAVKDAVGMMEQPSPVSVLDTPFYGEGSPAPVKKIPTAFPDHSISAYQSINQEHRCLIKILPEAGLLKDTSIMRTADQLHSSCYLNNYETFHAIQATEDLMKKTIEELIEKKDQQKLNHRIQRKFVSDIIDEIVARKVTSSGLLKLGTKRTSLQGLIKEVYLEMDHLCQLPYCNLVDEDDYGSLRLLSADMRYQSDDWTYSGELPALVLDIERLIFKDLINEVIKCEITGLLDWPTPHCRRLFPL